VSVSTDGEINEVAVLKADESGNATLTVSYVDENADANERVTLDDYRLKISVAEEKQTMNSLFIVIFIALIAAAVIILIAIANSRKRRRVYEERRERAAHKNRTGNARKRAKEERSNLMREDYERGYRDSEAEQFERATRAYDAPVIPPDPDLKRDDGEPEGSFSEDDIK
jgi:hypothetical protein